MSIIIDLIIIGIFGICIFFGYQKGLTKCMIKILSFFIAVIATAILFKPVSNFVIQNTRIDDTIKETVVNLVGNDIEQNGEVKEDTNLPKAMVQYINETVKKSTEEARESVIQVVAEEISITAVHVGVAILIFVGIRIALIFVSALSKLITDLPIIKQFDKTGGILYGAIKAFVIIFVLLSFLSFISPMIEQTGIITAINQSFIGSILYNHNLLLNILF